MTTLGDMALAAGPLGALAVGGLAAVCVGVMVGVGAGGGAGLSGRGRGTEKAPWPSGGVTTDEVIDALTTCAGLARLHGVAAAARHARRLQPPALRHALGAFAQGLNAGSNGPGSAARGTAGATDDAGAEAVACPREGVGLSPARGRGDGAMMRALAMLTAGAGGMVIGLVLGASTGLGAGVLTGGGLSVLLAMPMLADAWRAGEERGARAGTISNQADNAMRARLTREAVTLVRSRAEPSEVYARLWAVARGVGESAGVEDAAGLRRRAA